MPTQKIQVYDGTNGHWLRGGITAVTATLNGWLNTLPWAVYHTSPSTRTNGQGGPLEADASGNLMVSVAAGTAAIGKLAANSGVDIGDVDVTSTANPTGLATVATGERAGSVTAVQLATVAAKFVRLKAHTTNAGSIYVGGSNAVTLAAGTTTTTSGFQLASGDDSGWLPASNLNLFWIICENAGDDLTYMVMA